MSRLTLRLPESLHQALTHQAKEEGVSLNQLIVYLLTRTTTAADLEEQRQSVAELSDTEAALQEFLATRTP